MRRLLLITALFFVVSAKTMTKEGWNYGLMADLGSSGSRLGVFQWNSEEPVQNAPIGGPYWFKEVRPGVSSYSPPEAAQSLIPLLDYAEDCLNSINADISQTPVFLFATAGLRLLPIVESEAILDSIRYMISNEYDFLFEDDWARILTGTEEATFAWLTVQQLHLVYGNLESHKTNGTVDLGGGSVQLSFAIQDFDKDADLSTIQQIEFDNTLYEVYGKSYSQYGKNEARMLVDEILVEKAQGANVIANPCLLHGFNETVEIEGNSFVFYGTGDAQGCTELINELFPKPECDWTSCSFDGIYQPTIHSDEKFVGLDNLARIAAFYELGEYSALSLLESNANKFCETNWMRARWEYRNRTITSIPMERFCFDGLYAFNLLTSGFGFSALSTQILFTAELFGVTVSWTLGGMVNQVALLFT